jgi:outer membrane protein
MLSVFRPQGTSIEKSLAREPLKGILDAARTSVYSGPLAGKGRDENATAIRLWARQVRDSGCPVDAGVNPAREPLKGIPGTARRVRAPRGYLVLSCLAAVSCAAQTAPPTELTLAQAKTLALSNNPRIHSADAGTAAAADVVKEVRSARLPALTGLVTGVEAQHGTILAAGTLQTSSLYSRVASGIALSQLVTDFGRTANLTNSAQLRQQAQQSSGRTVREQVLLAVEESYFQALGGMAARRAAQAAVNNREVTLRQIRALAESSIRSTLDVQFAEVALSQAQLDLFQTENLAAESLSNLAAAMGLDHTDNVTLTDEPAPGALAPNADPLVQGALRKRPEAAMLTQLRDAARRFADAEGRLKLPTVSVLGTAGAIPAGDPRLPETYSAAGFNVSIPVLNGGLFSARRAEAEQRVAQAENDLRELNNQVAREVRNAWLEATTAARRVDVAARLLAEANEALRLAQTRYDAGLGSIVELSQAQFNQTSADIQNATAGYEYLSRRAALDYATGDLQ